MAIDRNGFLITDDGKKIVGVRNPDNTDFYFQDQPPKTRTTPLASNQTLINWNETSSYTPALSANAGETSVVDKTVLYDGYPTLRLTFATAGATLVNVYNLAEPIYITDPTNIQIPILTNNSTATAGVGIGGNDFQVWVGSGVANLRFSQLRQTEHSITDEWHVFNTIASGTSYNYGGNLGGSATNVNFLHDNAIASIYIVSVTAAAAATSRVWLGNITVGSRQKPVTCITLDGEYSSQWTMARQILNKYGLKASFAVQTGVIGNAGRMTNAQLDTLYGEGHEIIHHSANPKTSVGYGLASDWATSESIANDVKTTQAYFRNRGWIRGLGCGVHGYSDPLAAFQTPTRQNLVVKGLKDGGMRAMRRIINGDYYVPLGGHKSSPLSIPAGIFMDATSTAASINANINTAILHGAGSIITGHEFVTQSTTPTGNQIRINDFEGVCANIRTKIDNKTLDHLLFSELANKYYL